MGLNANGKSAKLLFLNNIPLDGDKLTASHGILYLRKVANTETGAIYPKLGQATANTYAGKTPAEVFESRYSSKSSEGGDPTADYIIVIDAPDENRAFDEECRIEGHRLFEANKVSFDCLYKGYQKPGFNTEALIDFEYSKFNELLEKVIKPALNLTDRIDIREPFVPRDYGTPVGQELMINELVDKVQTHQRAAFAGYTGVGKSHLGIASAHKLLPNGGLVLITTPIVDTAQSFEDNIKWYHYGDKRSLQTSLYREKFIEPGFIKSLRKKADDGELIFLLLTVQDVRYQDEVKSEDRISQIREKYKEFNDVKLDLWIRDEFHKEYGGEETIKIVDLLEKQTDYLIDLSATLRNLIEQGIYHLDQIVNRNFFWALDNRHYMTIDPVPELKVYLLGDIDYKSLPKDLQEMYDPTEGWNHKKMVETVDGKPKQFAGFKGLFTRAYTLEDDFDVNPWTINNRTQLCEEARKVGLWRFPSGDSTMSAEELYEPLAKSLRGQAEFKAAGVYIVSSWEISNLLPFTNTATDEIIKTVGDYVEHLKQQYNHVVIITQTKYCTGSDIPCLGHEVLCDNISSPATMEQFFPGRVFRRYPNKTDAALFVIAPGTSLKNNINDMAASAKKAEPHIDMSHYLKLIQISKYDIKWSEITATEMFEDFQSKLIEKIRAEISLIELMAIILNEDLSESLDGLNLTNKDYTDQTKEKNLTESNSSEVKDSNEEETAEEDGDNSSDTKDAIKVAAQSINAVMVEIPAFAIPENIINIEEAIGHRMIRLMFSDEQIDRIIAVMKQCPRLHRKLQDKLTEWHSANQNLSYDKIIDQVYRNTDRKKKIGLVFLKMDLARELVADISETFYEF